MSINIVLSAVHVRYDTGSHLYGRIQLFPVRVQLGANIEYVEDRRERHKRIIFRQVSAWANANMGDALSTRMNVTKMLHLPTSESET